MGSATGSTRDEAGSSAKAPPPTPPQTPPPTPAPYPLPSGPPSRQGVDAARVLAFLDAVDAADDIELHSMVILRRGHRVAGGWWFPYAPDRAQLLYSLSKVFTATAAGLAAAEGVIDLDAPVLDSFPEFAADIDDARSRQILVRHVAAMSSGHLSETWSRALAGDSNEPVRGFLRLPPDREPGSVFAYNQSATYALAAIVQRATGQTLTDYLRPRLLDPLGIGDVAWEQYPRGRAIGFTGLYATTDAVARLGQLYLRGGRWHDRQLLPRTWVEEATRQHIASPNGGGPDWRRGYGLQFWMSRHGYRGDGTYGQFCLVLPEQDAVIAITAATENMQGVLDAVWTHLLPAFGTVPEAPAAPDTDATDATDAADDADGALRRRLARLRLPTPAAEPDPPTERAAWSGVTFRPAGGVCQAQPSLLRVRLTRSEEGRWRITLAEPGSGIEATLATGDWHVAAPAGRPGEGPIPTAVSGGWTDADTLAFEVIFLETPHRLRVTCSLRARTFRARWHTAPLSPGLLRALRSPKG